MPSEREHVTPYIINHPETFSTAGYDLGDPELANLRLTVDDENDFKLVSEIYRELYVEGQVFMLPDILQLLVRKPALLRINQGTTRNEGYLKSLIKDKNFF